MAKRLTSLVLALILLLALLPGGVLAADTVSSATCGNGLTWKLDSTGLLTVSGSGAMDGKSSDVPCYRDSITAVSLQKGVTSSRENISKVKLPEVISYVPLLPTLEKSR